MALSSDPLRDPERLRSLRNAGLLHGLPDESLDRITRLAARFLDAPVALVNLIDAQRQLSASCVVPEGWAGEREASLEDSFCRLAVVAREPLAIEDALSDPRVSSSRMVTELNIRSYLGVPLITSEGHALGTLCVSDFHPRRWKERELEVLNDLAGSVITEIELRLVHAELELRVEERTAELIAVNQQLQATLGSLRQSEERLRLVADSVTDYAIVMLDPTGRVVAWNTGAALTTGYSAEEAVGRPLFELLPTENHDPGVLMDELAEAREHGHSVREGWRVRKDGTRFWVRQVVTPIRVEGELIGFAKVAHDLTEKRARQEALEREREFIRALLENLSEGIVACDAQGQLTLFNRAAREMHGLSPEPLPFDRHPEHYDLYLPDGETRMRTEDIPLYRALHGEVVRSAEMVIRPRGGAPRTLLASGRAIHGSDGRKLGAVIAMHDITERKLSEERERDLAREQAARAEADEARHRLQVILDSIADPFLVFDANGCFAYTNGQAEALFGRAREELIGRPFLELFPDMADTVQYRAVQRAIQEGHPQEVEARSAFRPDRWYHLRIFPVDGGVAVYARDTTARREFEQALRESEERFRQLVTGVREVFWMVEPECTQGLYVSPGYQRLFGRDPATFLENPQSCLEAVVPADREQMLHLMAGLKEGPNSAVVQIVRPDGELRWVRMSGFPVHDEQGRVYRIAGTMDDITEQRQAEEALLAAKEQAERANRAKSEFLSRMSHELRTPLNAILGFGQLLEVEVETEDNRESVEQILRAGRHLLALIDEVLDLAKIEAGRMSLSVEPVTVRPVVGESVDLVRTLARQRDLSLRVSCDEHAVVHADPQRLKQVLLNLLSNAIKYNHEGGEVSVTCRAWGEGRLRIEVRDTGPGISPDRLARLFTPFERLDAERRHIGGTGLGLVLSRGLVQAMGGELGVESTPEEGSTFWVELRTHEAPAGDEAEDGAESPAGARERTHEYRILYIEDNIANLRLIERVLERRGDIDISAAMQGRLGLELAREIRPSLILLDLHLPDMPGEEVMRSLQADESLREIPVVVISADATERQKERLRQAGAVAYLTKPIEVRVLLETVEQQLPSRAERKS